MDINKLRFISGGFLGFAKKSMSIILSVLIGVSAVAGAEVKSAREPAGQLAESGRLKSTASTGVGKLKGIATGLVVLGLLLVGTVIYAVKEDDAPREYNDKTKEELLHELPTLFSTYAMLRILHSHSKTIHGSVRESFRKVYADIGVEEWKTSQQPYLIYDNAMKNFDAAEAELCKYNNYENTKERQNNYKICQNYAARWNRSHSSYDATIERASRENILNLVKALETAAYHIKHPETRQV